MQPAQILKTGRQPDTVTLSSAHSQPHPGGAWWVLISPEITVVSGLFFVPPKPGSVCAGGEGLFVNIVTPFVTIQPSTPSNSSGSEPSQCVLCAAYHLLLM